MGHIFDFGIKRHIFDFDLNGGPMEFRVRHGGKLHTVHLELSEDPTYSSSRHAILFPWVRVGLDRLRLRPDREESFEARAKKALALNSLEDGTTIMSDELREVLWDLCRAVDELRANR